MTTARETAEKLMTMFRETKSQCWPESAHAAMAAVDRTIAAFINPLAQQELQIEAAKKSAEDDLNKKREDLLAKEKEDAGNNGMGRKPLE